MYFNSKIVSWLSDIAQNEFSIAFLSLSTHNLSHEMAFFSITWGLSNPLMYIYELHTSVSHRPLLKTVSWKFQSRAFWWPWCTCVVFVVCACLLSFRVLFILRLSMWVLIRYCFFLVRSDSTYPTRFMTSCVTRWLILFCNLGEPSCCSCRLASRSPAFLADGWQRGQREAFVRRRSVCLELRWRKEEGETVTLDHIFLTSGKNANPVRRGKGNMRSFVNVAVW